MKKHLKNFWEFVKEVFRLFGNPSVISLPAQMAFYLILSLIPSIYLLGFLTGIFRITSDYVIKLIKTYTIEDLSSFIEPFLVPQEGEATSVIAFLLFALYLSSRAMNSVVRASDIVFDVEVHRSWWKTKLISMVLMLGLILLILFLILIPIIGNTAINILENNNLLPPFLDTIWDILKFPISLLVIFWGLQFLYHFAPNTDVSRKDTSFGALFSAIGWIFVSFIYSYYLNNFSNYSVLYGSFSSVIVLLLYFFFISQIFVIGIVINAIMHQRKTQAKQEKQSIGGTHEQSI